MTPEELKRLIMDAVKELLPESYSNKKGRLLTRQETAAILRISLATLNKWTKNGKIVAFRGNSRIRYYEADVYAALESTNKYKRFN
jgi:hypothetical protein